MEKVFAYCERSQDPGFWAEPLNAITNFAFLVAAFAAALLWRRRGEGSILLASLPLLVASIGVGSFLFHTYAEPWSGAADVIPIGLFMLTSVYVIARRSFGLRFGRPGRRSWRSSGSRRSRACSPPKRRGWWSRGRRSPSRRARCICRPGRRCSSPGWACARLGRPGGGALLAAGGVFSLSLALRMADNPLCERTIVDGAPIGLHFLWPPAERDHALSDVPSADTGVSAPVPCNAGSDHP